MISFSSNKTVKDQGAADDRALVQKRSEERTETMLTNSKDVY